MQQNAKSKAAKCFVGHRFLKEVVLVVVAAVHLRLFFSLLFYSYDCFSPVSFPFRFCLRLSNSRSTRKKIPRSYTRAIYHPCN